MSERLDKYRAAVYEAVRMEIERDDHHKSYEGAVEVTQLYPNYFERENPPTWCVTLHCYVLGPTRHYEYFGKTLDVCLDKAERDLKNWTSEAVKG